MLNPLKLALKDFDFNDLAYAKLKVAEHSKFDPNVVIVNIADADREGLAMLIEKTASFKPLAIGLDVWMEEPGNQEDSLLATAMRQKSELIIASRFKPCKGHEESEYNNHFTQFTHSEEGFVNFLTKNTQRSGCGMHTPNCINMKRLYSIPELCIISHSKGTS